MLHFKNGSGNKVFYFISNFFFYRILRKHKSGNVLLRSLRARCSSDTHTPGRAWRLTHAKALSSWMFWWNSTRFLFANELLCFCDGCTAVCLIVIIVMLGLGRWRSPVCSYDHESMSSCVPSKGFIRQSHSKFRSKVSLYGRHRNKQTNNTTTQQRLLRCLTNCCCATKPVLQCRWIIG